MDFKHSFVKAYNIVLADKNLNPTEKIVFLTVTSLDNGARRCTASYEYLAEMCGMTKRNVIRTISTLEEKGYVSVLRSQNKKVLASNFTDFFPDDDLLRQSGCQNDTEGVSICHSRGVNLSPNKIIDNISDKISNSKVSKVNFTEHQGEENPHMPDVGYFDHVDIHNDFILADALKKMLRSYNIDESMRAYKHPYILLSTFAETYREKKHRKHDEIHYSKLQEYVGRLIKFTPIAVDDNIFEGIPKSHSFSIFDYTEDEVRMMVDDFFNYDFSDADYSLHLFMSNDVLEARFWQIENRRTDIAM